MELQTYSERPSAKRDRLRIILSRHYRMEQYDLFFVPSMHVARVLLSQLFLRQEQMRNQTRYASHFPVTELNVLPAVPLMAGNINLVSHIGLPQGVIYPLNERQRQGVVDASESFASVLHDRVINEANLFVTCLDRHAALPGGLVMVALRTADFSTLVRSELRLFEQGLPLNDAVNAAMNRIREESWHPYNVACVDKISLTTPVLLNSSHQPGLPFASFTLPKYLLATLEAADDLQCWLQQDRLVVRVSQRGSGRKSVNHTQRLSKRLQMLFSPGGKSEKKYAD